MSNASFSAVMNLLRIHSRIEERFAGALGAIHGLALNEVLLLMHLEQAPAQRLSRVDLAKRLSVSPSTVTRMCAPLEKLHLVGREPDKRDARLAYVVLSAAGRRVVGEARATLEQLAGEVFGDGWSTAEIATLNKSLARVLASPAGDLS